MKYIFFITLFFVGMAQAAAENHNPQLFDDGSDNDFEYEELFDDEFDEPAPIEPPRYTQPRSARSVDSTGIPLSARSVNYMGTQEAGVFDLLLQPRRTGPDEPITMELLARLNSRVASPEKPARSTPALVSSDESNIKIQRNRQKKELARRLQAEELARRQSGQRYFSSSRKLRFPAIAPKTVSDD